MNASACPVKQLTRTGPTLIAVSMMMMVMMMMRRRRTTTTNDEKPTTRLTLRVMEDLADAG